MGKRPGFFVGRLLKAAEAIGDHRAKPIANSFFANLFFHLLDAAEFQQRGTLRFLLRYARANVFFRHHLKVAANLLVEICLDTAGEKEISRETSEFHK